MVVVAYDCDQYSVVVTVWFGGSLIITVSVPPGGAVTVVVVAYDCDQYSVVVTVWFGGSLMIRCQYHLESSNSGSGGIGL